MSKLTPYTAWTTATVALQEAAPDREVLDQVADLDEGRLAGPHRLRDRALAHDTGRHDVAAPAGSCRTAPVASW